MDIVSLIISLISGAVGGNAAGAAFKPNDNLGFAVNTIAGLVGGAAGDYILKAYGLFSQVASSASTSPDVMHAASNLDLTQILATVGTSGVSGAALLAVITLIKNALSK